MNIFQIDKLHKHTEYHRKTQEPLIITAKEKTTPKLMKVWVEQNQVFVHQKETQHKRILHRYTITVKLQQ